MSYNIFHTADRATVYPPLQTELANRLQYKSPTANRATVYFLLQTVKSSTADRAMVYQGQKDFL
jgi:hypothetical protein